MGRLLIVVWLIGVLVTPKILRSQNALIESTFDSNCYVPNVGDPNEIDTIYGRVGSQQLGYDVRNLGPKASGGFGNLLIGCLSKMFGASEVETGPEFNLHSIVKHDQRMSIGQLVGGDNGYVLGHFHDRTHTDLFNGIAIYWADDAGNYDSSRTTSLRWNVRAGTTGRVLMGPIFPWYVAHLTSDTVDDIVISVYNTDPTNEHDTAFALLYKGGAQLFAKDTTWQDTSALMYYVVKGSYSTCVKGDFRGTGREDLVIYDEIGDVTFFKNDRPFDLEKFAAAVGRDTIHATWQDPKIWNLGTLRGWYSMKVLPKHKWDNSVDLLLEGQAVNPPAGIGDSQIFVFRGGPDFGSHRILIDSAAFVFHHPHFGFNWPMSPPIDCGDMTGTGHHVMYVQGGTYGLGHVWGDTYYVLGDALDDKIDMVAFSSARGIADTLTANNDSLQDLMIGRPQFTGDDDYTTPANHSKGTLWVVYGSKKIPVHLNPEWASVNHLVPAGDLSISFAPNPTIRGWSIMTINWPEAEEGELRVSNMLGSVVQQESLRLLGGAEQQRIYFRGLPDGVYEVTLRGRAHAARARVVIVR